VHLFVDQTMTAEHGYTGLSRATSETHIWMADPPGPTGDCGHLHCRPAVENRMDSLVRQLSNSGVRPIATEPHSAVQTMTDRELINRRDELFELFSDGPLNQPTIDSAAIDPPSDMYAEILHEIDRRVAARTVLWQIEPPEDLLAELGSRSESPNPQAWDAAVAVYARTRLDVGPEVDLLDPAVPRTAQWRDIALEPIETSPPILRLTG
jgi:hypothetical protein